MILKHIYLYLNLEEYPDDMTNRFSFETRYICNFIERCIKPLRFKAEGFSKIAVQGSKHPSETVPILPENALVPQVPFDRAQYESLKADEYSEFFLSMLESGLRKCCPYHSIPIEELLSAIDSFRRGGYVNHWIHQKKKLRPFKLEGLLKCEVDIAEFRLFLAVFQKNNPVFRECILRTEPDEIIFQHQFKEMTVSGDDLLVLDKFGKTLYSTSIAGLDV